MRYLRSVVITFAFILFGIGAAFFNFLVFPLAKFLLKENNFINFSSNTIHFLWALFARFLEIIGLIKIKVKDIEKLKNIQNKVIVATHHSFIDVLLLMAIIPKSTCFVKNTLTKNFVLKNIVNSIFIPNDVEIEELKSQTKKYLDLGFNVIIFPMGTRYKEGERPKIKKGASLIAMNSKKDIAPVKISLEGEFLFINKPFYSAGDRVAKFTIETLELISLEKCFNESEIIMKRNITEEISKSLYN